MARIIVKGAWRAEAEILAEEDEGLPYFLCSCGHEDSAPYSLADTIELATRHVDYHCPLRAPASE